MTKKLIFISQDDYNKTFESLAMQIYERIWIEGVKKNTLNKKGDPKIAPDKVF